MAKLTEMLPKWLKETAKDVPNEGTQEKKEKEDNEDYDNYDDDFEEDESENIPVVIRFMGTTAESSTTRALLTSLIEQIIKITGSSEEVATVSFYIIVSLLQALIH